MKSTEHKSIYMNSQPNKHSLQPKVHYQPSNKPISKQSSVSSNKSTSIIKLIKRKPYTQMLEGVEVTYSILLKKQQNFILTHERLLVLTGIQTIAYVREPPQSQILPFQNLDRMPEPKWIKKLSEIERVTISNDKNLIINFKSQNKKITWEFVCPSQMCAFEWNRKITEALQLYEQYTKSNIQTTGQFMQLRNAKEGGGNQYNLVNFLKNHKTAKLETIKEEDSKRSHQPTKNSEQNAYQTNHQNFQQSEPNRDNKQQYYNEYWKINHNSNPANYSSANNTNKQPNKTHQPYSQPATYQIPSINNFLQQPYSSQPRIASQLYQNPAFQPKIQRQSPNKDYKKDANRDKNTKKYAKQQKQKFLQQIGKLRRNWTQQLIGQSSYIQLVMDFKKYVEKIAEFIINQLSVSQQQRIVPAYQQKSELNIYVFQDIYFQIYLMDKNEEKHVQYKQAKAQFKNMQYLLSVTSDIQCLKIPLIAFFQFKGFIAKGKMRVKENTYFQALEFRSHIDSQQFQQQSRISFQTLLNESKTRIISYVSKTRPGLKFYFVDILTELLPLEKGDLANNSYKQLRPQLIKEDQLDGIIFRDKKRPFASDKITKLIDQKENKFVRILQNEEEYFTNSKELGNLLHELGLNIRRLGSIYQKSRLSWLKKILRAELLARCLKTFYRADFQSNFRVQSERIATKQRQQQIEQKRVISFLNVFFGISEGTNDFRKKLNIYCKRQFGSFAYSSNYTDINIPYFLQAIQTHLKIVLSDKILQKQYFKSNSSLQHSDFIRFESVCTIYNLDFTYEFEEIYAFLCWKSQYSYDQLIEFLSKKNENMSTSYFQLLKNHEIYDRVCTYMLLFKTPQQMQKFNRVKVNSVPSKHLIERKISQIKWHLKWDNIQQLNTSFSSFQNYVKRWLVDLHPLIVQVNRLIAQYLISHETYYEESLKYAQNALAMHQKIFGKDFQKANWNILWKDYFLLGRSHLVCQNTKEAVKYLTVAKELVKPEELFQLQEYGKLYLNLCKARFESEKYAQGYLVGLQFYNFAKEQDDEILQDYAIKVVYWILKVLEAAQDDTTYYSFLQKFSTHVQLMYQQYPDLLIPAIMVSAMYPLNTLAGKRSKNLLRYQMIVYEAGRINTELLPNLGHYISDSLSDGVFLLNFLGQLKQADRLMDIILDQELLDEWEEMCSSQNQQDFDKQIANNKNEGLSFLINMTSVMSLIEPGGVPLVPQ